MPSDAHAHPNHLMELFPQAEEERRRLGVRCAASATTLKDFEFNEELSRRAAEDGKAEIIPCYAVHPQMPAGAKKGELEKSLETLFLLAQEGRIRAIGEAGFDLYDKDYKESEKTQERLFLHHLEIAQAQGLPMVLHIRKAMHRVFEFGPALKRVRALVFHSYMGTHYDALSLLKHGINAYFSFGNPVILNHKTAMEAAAKLPPERLLFETDAPFQPQRFKQFSSWSDLGDILQGVANLRSAAESPLSSPEELEALTDRTFSEIFLSPANPIHPQK